MKWNGGGLRRSATSWGRAAFGRKDLGYGTMTVEAIKALPVAGLADDDAHLFLWAPDQFLISGEAGQVAESWGFTPGRVLLFWAKPGIGLGHFPRPQHEAVLVCRRGSLPWLRRDVGSVQEWPQPYGPAGRSIAKIGSAKPEHSLDLIESVSPGPYLELFARRQRLGWDTWGNEALNHVDLGAA
jgi:N6-adenosine-specific RNA methylase IME4